MLKTFTALTPFIKFKKNKISIDNLAFKFHYRATFLLLLVCTLLVTSRQYIGEHIRCISGGSIPDHVINTFCFFTTTFTVVRHYNESMLEKGFLPHPGIGPMQPEENVKYHAYYQWVPFMLFGQALMFYFPHFLWHMWEGGRIKHLVEGLQMISLSKHNQNKTEMRFSGNYVLPCKAMVDNRVSVIKDTFYKHIRINKMFATRLLLCETINLINLLIQIYYTNVFLNGQFYTLGNDFIKDDFMGAMDVLDVVFPKVTKCNFYKYGQSGSIQRHDALCVMALNIVNEKIFVVLWFWYCVMVFVSVMGLLWRLLTLMLHSSSVRFNRLLFSSVCPGRLNTQDLTVVTSQLPFSDWMFLYYLATNMEPYVFCNLLSDLAHELRRSSNNEHQKLLVEQITAPDTPDSIDEVELRKK